MKHCTGCVHFRFEQEERGYSEYTPGSSASFECLKAHWAISLYRDTQESLCEKLWKAKDCEDFSPRQR